MNVVTRSQQGHAGSRAEEVLRVVHASPGITRAQVARDLGMSSGQAADTVHRLVDAALVAEYPADPTGGRGRPTRALGPHPDGPLVLAAVIAHESWEVSAVAVGGDVVASRTARHERDRAPTLEAVAQAIEELWEQHGARVRALAVAVPGTVSGTLLVQAPNLNWRDVELAQLRPPGADGLAVVAGNDATLSALAEGRRGAAREATAFVYLYMDSGIGGALVQDGALITGARGLAGEFGHLPLGDPAQRCRCGARGCWNTTLDGYALARRLRVAPPPDDVTFSRQVLAAAAAAPGSEQAAAAREAAVSLGRGVAGLANALDPELICLGGLADELVSLAPEAVDAAYRDGLMSTLAVAPPPVRSGMLGAAAPRWGAVDLAFEQIVAELGRGERQPPAG